MCRAGSARGNGRFEHGTVLSSGGEGLDRSSSGQADRGGHDAPGNALGAACQARSLLFAGEPVTGAAKRAEAVVSQEASTVRRPSPRPSSGCCAVYNTALAGRLRVCCAPQTVVWFLQYASVMSLLSPPVQQSVCSMPGSPLLRVRPCTRLPVASEACARPGMRAYRERLGGGGQLRQCGQGSAGK